MSSSEVEYRFVEERQMLIAIRDGRAIGLLPWMTDGQTVYLYQENDHGIISACVAPHERRKGIGSEMATRMRAHFPREDGWTIRTSELLTPQIADHFYREGKDDRREGWFDFTGQAGASGLSTIEVTGVLALAQDAIDNA